MSPARSAIAPVSEAERDQTLRQLFDDLLFRLDGELELLKLEALSS